MDLYYSVVVAEEFVLNQHILLLRPHYLQLVVKMSQVHSNAAAAADLIQQVAEDYSYLSCSCLKWMICLLYCQTAADFVGC